MPAVVIFWLLLCIVAAICTARFVSRPVEQLPVLQQSKWYYMTIADLFSLTSLTGMILGLVTATWPHELPGIAFPIFSSFIAVPFLLIAVVHVNVLSRRGISHQTRRLVYLSVWLPCTVAVSVGMAVGLLFLPSAILAWRASEEAGLPKYSLIVFSIVGGCFLSLPLLRLLNTWIAAGQGKQREKVESDFAV